MDYQKWVKVKRRSRVFWWWWLSGVRGRLFVTPPPLFSVNVVLTSVRSLGPLLQQLQWKKDALWLAGRVTCAAGLHYPLPLSVVSTEAPTGPGELHSNKSVHLHAIQRHRISNVSYNYVNQTNLLDWLIEMSIIKQNAVRDQTIGHLAHVTNQNSPWKQIARNGLDY